MVLLYFSFFTENSYHCPILKKPPPTPPPATPLSKGLEINKPLPGRGRLRGGLRIYGTLNFFVNLTGIFAWKNCLLAVKVPTFSKLKVKRDEYVSAVSATLTD